MTTWNHYSSDLEHFTAEFPGAVERRFLGSFQDDGLSPATITYTCKLDRSIVYQISVTRVEAYWGSPHDLLETALEAFTTSITGSVVVESDETMFKCMAALRFLLKVGQYLDIRGLSTLSDRTMYFLTLMHPRGTKYEFERFCASFEVIP